MIRKLALTGFAAGLLLSLAPVAQAALTTFNARTGVGGFEAALVPGSAKTEDFESFVNGLATPLSLQFGTGSAVATLDSVPGGLGVVSGDSGSGRHNVGAVGPEGGLWFESTRPFTLIFGTGVNAFGFDATDIGDFGTDTPGSSAGNVLRVELYKTAGGVTADATYDFAGSSSNASEMFFGFVDPSQSYEKIVFTNLTFNGRTAVDGQGFDQFTIGAVPDLPPNPTPEPGILALLGVGLLAAVVAKGKRTR